MAVWSSSCFPETVDFSFSDSVACVCVCGCSCRFCFDFVHVLTPLGHGLAPRLHNLAWFFFLSCRCAPLYDNTYTARTHATFFEQVQSLQATPPSSSYSDDCANLTYCMFSSENAKRKQTQSLLAFRGRNAPTKPRTVAVGFHGLNSKHAIPNNKTKQGTSQRRRMAQFQQTVKRTSNA